MARRRGRSAVQAKADTGDSTVRVSLNLYSALQVNPAASRSTLSSNFNRLQGSPPSSEYSDDMLESRAMILKLAFDNLTDANARHKYDRQVSSGEAQIDIDFADVPGALSLQQEAGQTASVIRLGGELLAAGTCGLAVSADIALVVAQAYCDMAASVAERDEIAAFDSMEAALKFLTDHSSAPRLQTEISDALEDLKPTVVLKTIAEPLGSKSAARRQNGLKLLLQVLAGEGATWTALQKDEYLAAVRPHMTADEQIKLWEEQQKVGQPALSEVQDAALAFLAEGMRRRWPPHIARAEKMLLGLEADARTATPQELTPFDGQVDVTLELAVCRLLLGDAVAAYQILIQGGAPEVQALIEELAGEGGDRLLGVCGLVHRVLVEVQLPTFRCCQAINAPLTYWFDSKPVTAYLQAVDVWRLLQLNNLLGMARRSVSSILGGAHNAASGAGSAMKASVGSLQQRSFALQGQPASGGNGAGNDPGHLAATEDAASYQGSKGGRDLGAAQSFTSSSRRPSQPALAATQGAPTATDFDLSAGRLAAGGWSRAPTTNIGGSSDTSPRNLQSPPETAGAGSDRISIDVPGGGNGSSNGGRDYLLASSTLREAVQRGEALNAEEELSEGDGDVPAEAPLPLQLMKLEGEQEMWAPLEARRRRRFRSIVAVALAGGLATVAAAAAVSSRKGRPALPPSDGITTPMAAQSGKVSPMRRLVAHPQFTQDFALKLVNNWQGAKARALGPRHQMNVLDSVLTGPMHRAWLGQAQAFKDHNTHCVFHLKGVNIQSLEVGSRSDGAIITAVVDETREFVNSETDTVIMKTSDASVVQYRAVRCDGTWKLQTFEFR